MCGEYRLYRAEEASDHQESPSWPVEGDYGGGHETFQTAHKMYLNYQGVHSNHTYFCVATCLWKGYIHKHTHTPAPVLQAHLPTIIYNIYYCPWNKPVIKYTWSLVRPTGPGFDHGLLLWGVFIWYIVKYCIKYGKILYIFISPYRVGE